MQSQNNALPQQCPTVAPVKALAGLALLLPLLFLPLIVLAAAGPAVLLEHASLARYREVGAVVVATGVERRPGVGRRSATSWVPRVTFRYTVDGVDYTADRVTPADAGGTERSARRHIAAYHAGQRVEAYYDPQSPGRAFLERGSAPALTPTFFLPAPLLALALWAAASKRNKLQLRLARLRSSAATAQG